jgi:predicted 3-demethylubiquinone-9 3-methyltransferase (glyoxalase superfamily)
MEQIAVPGEQPKEEPKMICPRCGKDLGEENVCDLCGCSAEQPPPADGKAAASLVLGIVSLLTCGGCGILPLIGLVLGLGVKSKPSGTATTGIVLNAIALLLGLIVGFVLTMFGFSAGHYRPIHVPPRPHFVEPHMDMPAAIPAEEHSKKPSPQRLVPFLTFTGNAEEAMKFYAAVLPGAKIESIARFETGERGDTGKVCTGILSLLGQQIMFLDMEAAADRPAFSWAASLYLDCKDEAEFNAVVAALSKDGIVMMEPAPILQFRKAAWITDKFGVTWQPVWK